MEVVASILGSLVAEPARRLWVSIYSSIKNTMKFKSNLNTLDQKMKILIDLRNDTLQIAEGELTTPMKEWLIQVQAIELQVNPMQTGVAGSLNCCLSTRMARKLAEVERLLEEYYTSFASVNYQVTKVEYIPGPSIESQPTASKNLAKIMDLLNDDGVRIIAVWGMGGVGKTALVKNLNNKLKSDSSNQPFSIVIWATVSKELDLKKVQIQIAERLRLEVKLEESVESIACRLYQRLRKQKKFLIILDDVWETIDLDTLGVPQPEVHEGSKIILTSRSLDVYRVMKADIHVTVDVLSDDESWELFRQNAGEVASSTHIKTVAVEVSRECSGLPLAIITVGTAMRGKSRVELWKDARNELRRSEPNISGIETKLYKPLKWSYDSLEGKNIKPCFLYCSLFPEDFSIEVSELVQCWVAEGLIDEQQNYEDSFNRGIAIVETLKDSCLLEPGLRGGTVRMHDVVRDIAVWISASLEDGCKSMVRSGIGLSQISDVESLKSFKRISFMNNKITTLPDLVIHCRRASTLLLQGNSTLEKIPGKFLLGFQALNVLNLSETCIQSLPHSLNQLGELRALFLRGCSRLQQLPPLGGLRKLQFLDLCATGIGDLPEGMEEMEKLRQINLSRSRYLDKFQSLPPSITPLLHFNMTECAYKCGVNGEENTILELGCLEPLVSVYIWLDRVPQTSSSNRILLGRLKRFRIAIGSGAHEIELPIGHDERKVILSNIDLTERNVRDFLINASSLVLNSCREVDSIFRYLSTKHFPGLKSLAFASSQDLASLRGRRSNDLLVSLPNLEEIYINHNDEIESLLLLSKLGSLPRLRSIEVSQCSNLVSIFPLPFPCLKNLEEIKISSCNNLKELFQSSPSMTPPLRPERRGSVVPKLWRLELKDLPRLVTLYSEMETWSSLEQLEVTGCDLLRTLPLTIQNANTIKEIRGEHQWWSNLEWDHNNTKRSLLPYFSSL